MKRWLARLLADPDNFQDHAEDMASKIMCTLTWDDHTQSTTNTRSAWHLLHQISPAGLITNVLKPLWHLPLPVNPWKRGELKRHDEQREWWLRLLQQTRTKMRDGTHRPCFATRYLENEKKNSIEGDWEASAMIGMLALVGISTVAGPIAFFLMAMVHHPAWLAKVQAEIDEACGCRMPGLGDFERLPVLRACICETMRWRPNLPTGVAHESEGDQYYKDWFIPKGACILPLDWYVRRSHLRTTGQSSPLPTQDR